MPSSFVTPQFSRQAALVSAVTGVCQEFCRLAKAAHVPMSFAIRHDDAAILIDVKKGYRPFRQSAHIRVASPGDNERFAGLDVEIEQILWQKLTPREQSRLQRAAVG